jgi:hypothetical protein
VGMLQLVQYFNSVNSATPVSTQDVYTPTTNSPVINVGVISQSVSLYTESKKYFEDMAIGAGLLGSGGGGDTAIGELMINQLLETGFEPKFVEIDSLHDDNDFIVAVGAMARLR